MSYLMNDKDPVIQFLSLQHRMQLSQENREMFLALSKWNYECYLQRKIDSRYLLEVHREQYLTSRQIEKNKIEKGKFADCIIIQNERTRFMDFHGFFLKTRGFLSIVYEFFSFFEFKSVRCLSTKLISY